MGTVLVPCHSQEYGNTRRMAEAVGEGAREAGAEVTQINTNGHRFAPEAYRGVDAVAFGSPDDFGTIAGGLKVFLDDGYIARKADRPSLEKGRSRHSKDRSLPRQPSPASHMIRL